jgi:hypothetical protein
VPRTNSVGSRIQQLPIARSTANLPSNRTLLSLCAKRPEIDARAAISVANRPGDDSRSAFGKPLSLRLGSLLAGCLLAVRWPFPGRFSLTLIDNGGLFRALSLVL